MNRKTMKKQNNISQQYTEKDIQNYLTGNMSSAGEHEFEKAMLDDSFLSEAVEGYRQNPHFETLKRTRFKLNKKLVSSANYSVYFLIAIFLIGVFGIWFWNRQPESVLSGLARPDGENYISRSTTEPGERPNTEREMVETSKTDSSISFTFIVENEEKLDEEETFVEITRSSARENEVPEKAEPIKNFERVNERTEKENLANDKLKHPAGNPIYHIENYKVVDYRNMRNSLRENEEELIGGLPPNRENEDARPSSDPAWQTDEIGYADFLENSVFLFANGQYKKALSNFKIILNHYPDDANALFYGGMSAFHLREFDKAANLLSQSAELRVSTFAEESAFYHAKSLIGLGRNPAARDSLKSIVRKSGFYSERAQQLLKTLK